MNNTTIFNKNLIPPGAINWWILDVRVTAVLRDSRLGLSPFLLLSGEGSRWLILELVTVVLLWQIVNDWVWLVLFGGPFCELDNTPNFWLRNVKFWTSVATDWQADNDRTTGMSDYTAATVVASVNISIWVPRYSYACLALKEGKILPSNSLWGNTASGGTGSLGTAYLLCR